MEYISVPAELQALEVKWQQASDAEIKVICPFHNDGSPSLYINTESKLCKCQACGWGGTFVGYVGQLTGKDLGTVEQEFKQKYGIKDVKTIAPQRIRKAVGQIKHEHALRQELYKRGVTDAIIRENNLGVERGRITIPIYDERGYCINLRKYLPGAEGSKKFRDERGCGTIPRIYPISQLSYGKMVICGGEIKALSAAKHLNPHGIGAISATGGEGRWSEEISEKLQGKEQVFIAYDIDDHGKAAALKIATLLNTYVEWLGIVELPMDATVFPKGGVDDFLQNGGNLIELLKVCPEWEPPSVKEDDYDSEPAEFHESLAGVVHSDNVGRRISADCIVSSLDTMPYSIPKEVKVTCPKNVAHCGSCSFYPVRPENMIKTIHGENPAVLGMIDVPITQLPEQLKAACSIPLPCKVCSFEVLKYQNAEDTRVSEDLVITKRMDDKAMVPAVMIADKIDMNTPYTVTGRIHPHPKTNQAVLLISEVKKKKDSLSSFDTAATDHLKIFRPDHWNIDYINHKLNEVYDDLEANVTNIYQRRKMHIMVDLTYHSPLFIDFEGKRIKGWVETLIIGDSSQGKTETVQNLQNHYDLGGWLSCKGASFAGVLGGAQQINKKWFITWGAMPLADRGLLVLEELKGLPIEVFDKLTDCRSTGRADLAKIERRQTYARVRLCALSNPRSDRSIGTYNSGVQVIQELIGGLEDIRRFDAFYIAKKEDIDEAVIGEKRECEHRFTTELCRDLVLWAWTMKSTRFEDPEHLLELSREFGRQYSDDVPIYDRGGGRYKIARLAAALACRTYSCEDPNEVLVRRCHVEWVCHFLHSIYKSPSFGYHEFSEQQKELEQLEDEDTVLAEINASPAPRHLARMILANNSISEDFLRTTADWSNAEGQTFMSLLLRTHCIKKGRKGEYYKNGSFVSFLKEALENNEVHDLPKYLDGHVNPKEDM